MVLVLQLPKFILKNAHTTLCSSDNYAENSKQLEHLYTDVRSMTKNKVDTEQISMKKKKKQEEDEGKYSFIRELTLNMIRDYRPSIFLSVPYTLKF